MAKDRKKFGEDGIIPRPGNKKFEDADLGFDSDIGKPMEKRPLGSSTPIEAKKEKTLKAMSIYGIDVDTVDIMKNILYTEKINGNFRFTQSDIIIDAIKQYIDRYDKEIVERPEEEKERELKLAKRKGKK